MIKHNNIMLEVLFKVPQYVATSKTPVTYGMTYGTMRCSLQAHTVNGIVELVMFNTWKNVDVTAGATVTTTVTVE